jgi:hypothetical protein
MRTLSYDNKPGVGKHWYLWHPEDLNNATPMDEVTWFVVYQPLLLKVVNCTPGRDLLGIPSDLPRIERILKNSIHWRTGAPGEWQSRFYVGAKYANAIRYQWPAFKRLAKTFYERQVYGRLILEPVLNVGGQLVAAHATDTFYPDPDTETTTVDGWSRRFNDATWSAARNTATATAVNDSALNVQIFSASRSGGWLIYRGHILFDTSSIPDANIISAATVGLSNSVSATYDTENDANSFVSIVTSSALTSNTAVGTGDYDAPTTTECHGSGERLDVGSPPAQNNYATFTLDSTGIAEISKTGVTTLGAREGHDINDDQPTTAPPSSGDTGYNPHSADATGTSNDPYLQVTHAAAFTPRTVVIM